MPVSPGVIENETLGPRRAGLRLRTTPLGRRLWEKQLHWTPRLLMNGTNFASWVDIGGVSIDWHIAN